MRKFEFNNPKEEIEVAGERYTVDFSDEKTLVYAKLHKQAIEVFQRQKDLDPETMTFEELVEVQETAKQYAKEFVDSMLVDGVFDTLYEKAGRSSVVFVHLMEFLNETLEEHFGRVKANHKSKYVKKAKK